MYAFALCAPGFLLVVLPGLRGVAGTGHLGGGKYSGDSGPSRTSFKISLLVFRRHAPSRCPAAQKQVSFLLVSQSPCRTVRTGFPRILVASLICPDRKSPACGFSASFRPSVQNWITGPGLTFRWSGPQFFDNYVLVTAIGSKNEDKFWHFT